MYSNGEGPGLNIRGKCSDRALNSDNEMAKLFTKKKSFIVCICPKCSARHNVYMIWSGRGVPRIYCGHCKPMVSGYDEAVYSVCPTSSPGRSNKNFRQ